MTVLPRIHLSSPHMGGNELNFVNEAFASNWIAPLGPQVDAFQTEFAEIIGGTPSLALSSGTAAIHLALILADVKPGDDVFVSTLTFSASVNPIRYLGANPIFIDSERESWNMDPDLLRTALEESRASGKLPKAVLVVHLYGQSADMDRIMEVCYEFGVPVIEDAAESLGTTYKGRQPGTIGAAGIFSFNGNKIITTSGGGMLVSPNKDWLAYALKLATQARDPAPHYEHSAVGYNYRLSNILAGIGRGQLHYLRDRVFARRRNFDFYKAHLGDLPGIEFMPEAEWGTHTRWLTTLTVNAEKFGASREDIRLKLESENIEARPVWKPMHKQPIFSKYKTYGGAVSEQLFEDGLCLPSGSNLTEGDLERVVEVIRGLRRVSLAGSYRDNPLMRVHIDR